MKKILSFLLVFALLIPAQLTTVFAAEGAGTVVEQLAMTGENPAVGQSIPTEITTSPHTTAEVRWFVSRTDNKAEGSFLPNKVYRLKVVLTADEGYRFSLDQEWRDLMTYNDIKADAEPQIYQGSADTDVNNIRQLVAYYTFPVTARLDQTETPTAVATAPSTFNGKDGQITVTSDGAVEWAATPTNFGNGVKTVVNKTISGLATGDYYIRYAQTDTHYTGNWAKVTVPFAERTPITPVQLAMTKPAEGNAIESTIQVTATGVYCVDAADIRINSGDVPEGTYQKDTFYYYTVTLKVQDHRFCFAPAEGAVALGDGESIDFAIQSEDISADGTKATVRFWYKISDTQTKVLPTTFTVNGIAAPNKGGTPAGSGDVQLPQNMRVAQVQWFADGTGIPFSTFNDTSVYSVRLTIQATNGYEFPVNKDLYRVTITGGGTAHVIDVNEVSITVQYDYLKAPKLWKQDPTTSANNDGQLGIEESNGDRWGIYTTMEYTTDPNGTWTTGKGGTALTDLTPGTYYVRAKANPRMEIAAGPAAKITIDPYVAAISSANLQLTAPATGKTPNQNVAGIPAGAALASVQWFDDTGAAVDEAFGTNRIYYAVIVLSAREFSKFDSSLTADVNGNSAICHVSSDGGTAEITYTFPATDKADQSAPTGLTGVSPTTIGGSDGKITGTTTDMEYADNRGFSGAKDCGDAETTGLAAGTYYVRYRATDTKNAGTAAVVTIAPHVEVIQTIAVTVTAPVSGAAPSEEVATTTAGITITAVQWLDSNTENPVTEPFAPATAYCVTLTVSPEDGYEFHEALTAEVNGNSAICRMSSDGSTAEITYTFPATEAKKSSSGSIALYHVRVDETDGGHIHLPRINAAVGTTVEFTVEIEDGFRLHQLTATTAAGVNVPVRETGTSYRFSMPAANVILRAAFEKNQAFPFADVPENAYCREAVEWGYGNGVAAGMSPDRFDPDGLCSRGQAMTFLWRGVGEPFHTQMDMPFADVPAGAYFYEPILWAVENGVAAGTSARTFSPDDTVSRGQILTFLWRLCGSPVSAEEDMPFTDVSWSAYYYDAVQWAVGEGIARGVGGTAFAPDAPCTRGQILTFIFRCVTRDTF